jgi:NAD(P)-dependent dehydrogenase (short-subunit alcohol dehydrogenase family)
LSSSRRYSDFKPSSCSRAPRSSPVGALRAEGPGRLGVLGRRRVRRIASKWTADQIPDQSGRTAIVTGANSGLGLVTARELARAGANVVLACRNLAKADAACGRILDAVPAAELEVRELDLSSLDSVRGFASDYRDEVGALDLLINNAGLMAPPRKESADGYELQFATNHLGHFALTGLLLGALDGREDARVVTVTSFVHQMGRIKFDNLQGTRNYNRWLAYAQSKLANLLFAFELKRRLRAAGSPIKSMAAHPGYAATELQTNAAPRFDTLLMSVGNRVLAQSADMGALPSLYAATYPGLESGLFIGPDGIGGQRGHPEPVGCAPQARSRETARRLWEASEELTGVSFELPAAAPV